MCMFNSQPPEKRNEWAAERKLKNNFHTFFEVMLNLLLKWFDLPQTRQKKTFVLIIFLSHNSYPMDLNGARRKNATRETTSTLKAWLNEHKKNPYPTKGEKIMLAIITKMTLTQVSTWFANARRRLKKENKMTWEPRNRVEDDDVNLDDDDHKSNDDKDLLGE
jgi:hypothetical protein